MKPRYQAVRGTRDLIGAEAAKLEAIVHSLSRWCARFGYEPIQTPIFEEEALFTRSIGGETDIVHKELYRFEDRKGRKLALRPEGTAGVVRALVASGVLNQPSWERRKYYYSGPMFRYDRPQAGRYRQFSQFGVECFGPTSGPMTYSAATVNNNPPPGPVELVSPEATDDAEQILLIDRWLQASKCSPYTLKLNSIGCPECRPAFVAQLQAAWRGHLAELCPDCSRRLEANPLRVLDCKSEKCYSRHGEPPSTLATLCAGCRSHHERVTSLLTGSKVAFIEDPRLVRGLDYYTRTTFEFVSGELGAQSAFLGGGRYDNLVNELGGLPTAAIGWAAGIDRLAGLVAVPAADIGPDQYADFSFEHWLRPPRQSIFFIFFSREIESRLFPTIITLKVAGIFVNWGGPGSQLKKQLAYAGKHAYPYAVIVGDDELAAGAAVVRDMRQSTQEAVPFAGLVEYLQRKFAARPPES